jgi:hypothetical protein
LALSQHNPRTLRLPSSELQIWYLIYQLALSGTVSVSTSSFLPRYTFEPIPKITNTWTEWTIGLNGFLSIREPDE